MSAEARNKYVVFEGMRGLAALTVVTYHVNGAFGASRWLPSAYLAVDLFFVLSGFVLAHAYEHRFAAGMTAWHFMRLRLIRLYPLYALALLYYLLSMAASGLGGTDISARIATVAAALPANLLFLPMLGDGAGQEASLFPLNVPAWSLFFELFVNALFVIFWHRLTIRTLMAVIGTAAAALLICAWHYGTLELGWNQETIGVGFARVLYGFPLGVLLFRLRNSIPRLLASPAPALLGTIILMIPAFAEVHLSAAYSFIAVTLLAPALVALGARASVKSALVTKFCLILGKASYGIYVFHSVVIFVFVKICRLLMGGYFEQYGGICAVIYLLSLLAGALVLDKYFDMPVRHWLTSRLRVPSLGDAARPRHP